MKNIILAALLAFSVLGLNAHADGPSERFSAKEASSHIGELATVCGKVVSTKYADRSNGQPTFLNFDRPYPDHIFTIVIWGDDRHAFGKPERVYSGKKACAKGRISQYRGRPQIVANSPEQLWIDG